MSIKNRVDPNDLDFDLYDTLSHLLRRSHFYAEGLFTSILGHHGVTARQLALMVVVSQNPNVSQRKVGELIALDINTTSELLRRMEKSGLVDRHASNNDGRTIEVNLSAKGFSILSALKADNQEFQTRLHERLSNDEAAQLKSLLRKLLDLKG